MARDYSKYSVNGEGKFSKSQLALVMDGIEFAVIDHIVV